MSEPAAHKAKEASKALQQDLKDALRTRDPWERDIEHQRKELRRKYLLLLLVFPHTRESKDVENHLWMQTSYQFITVYKQRVAKLDRDLQSAPRQQPRQGNHGPVEYRKLMQRFRQFLAEEEKFWIQLVSRYCRSFALDEASPALAALGIQSDLVDVASANPSDSPERDVAHNTRNGRHNSLFPSEESTPPVPPPDSIERENRLSILSKTLVCLGDIARYRELYNEGGGRPKAGHEDGPAPARRGRTRRGGVPGFESIPRARTYDRSQQCYEQARLLVPHEGNASHQLAILAFYQKDMFGSLIHYYKALCVRQPYDTASENMVSMLNKSLEQWKEHQLANDEDNTQPRIRVDNLKEKILVLHALWRFGADRVGSIPPDFAQTVVTDFAGIVSDRVLPTELISKVIVLSQGALWKHRMIRDSPASGKGSTISTDPPIAVESDIATHILALYRVLLEIGIAQLAVAPPEDAAENDLAQRITAVFRRTLPALRIASKWLTANLKYVIQAQSPANVKGDLRVNNSRTSSSALSISDVPTFWTAYARFYNVLLRSFPPDKLPSLSTPLEEDIDMKGFLPLRRLMGETKIVDGGGQKDKLVVNGIAPQGREKQVHPNEEQLMRIWDLLQDAKVVVAFEASPISLREGLFKYVGSHQKGADTRTALALPTERHEMHKLPVLESNLFPLKVIGSDHQHIEQDEDAMTEVTRTDDDPIDEAFRKVLNGSDAGIADDLEDEDKIIWDVGASAGDFVEHPTSPPLMSPRTPVRPTGNLISPTIAMLPTIPPAVSPVAAFQGTTAQDLLNNVMGNTRGNIETSRSQHHRPPISTVPQSRILGSSIWTMTPESSSGFGAVGSHSFARHTPSQSTSQTSRQGWASLFESTPNSQILLPGVQSNSLAGQSYMSVSPGHLRSYSATASAPRHQANHTLHQGSSSLSPGLAQHVSQRPRDLPPTFTDPAIISTGRAGSTNLHAGAYDYHYQNHSLPYSIGHSHGLHPISQNWANHG